jgi:hypothetical protein
MSDKMTQEEANAELNLVIQLVGQAIHPETKKAFLSRPIFEVIMRNQAYFKLSQKDEKLYIQDAEVIVDPKRVDPPHILGIN